MMQAHKIQSGNRHIIDPRLYTSYHGKAGSPEILWKKILKIVLLVGGSFCIIFGFWLKIVVVNKLPDISQVKDMVFSQSTIITDRNGEELYKLYRENREYIALSGMNENMINAIVAVEDKRYREHSGLDPIGMFRAAISKMLRPSSRLQGASTIPQQLVRNLLLTNDRKVTRKLKEIILAKKLNNVLKDQINKEQGHLSSTAMKKELKSRILELYLNYIPFGNNAYGLEAAAKTYFGIPASELTVLQSSILSSLPKGPSYYDPYKHRARMMGEVTITDSFGNKYPFSSGAIKDAVLLKMSSLVQDADLSDKKSAESFASYMKDILEFSLFIDGTNYSVVYTPGRKDSSLGLIYQAEYIKESELKRAFIEGLDYTFQKNIIPMKAPHFVQWIIELLEKEYDKELLMQGGFVVKTTLDLDIQTLAEKAVADNRANMESYGATNASLVYVDSQNGDVLSYIGSIDYFNEAIGGQNDMVRAPRQVGSSIKPFIYSLGFMTLPLTTETPIYDIPFKVGPDTPNNADGAFLGLLPLKKALCYSRNIPATKMILALGGEDLAKPFLRDLGLTSISATGDYGYTLALGAGEISMLEMANAYMHLSSQGKPAVMNPILEIRSQDGSILYQKTGEYQKEVIPAGVASVMWNILSDKNNLPPEWINRYSIRGLTYALKSGTSNMKTDKGDRARDGWLDAYTPSKVLLVWGGNADGSPMYKNAFGGFMNSAIVTNFLKDLLANNYIQNEAMTNVDTTTVTISKVSGKLASDTTPADFKVTGLAYGKSVPTAVDSPVGAVQYDASCNGKASPYTPKEQLRNGYIITPESFMPSKMDLAEITQWWAYSMQLTGEKYGAQLSGKVSFNVPGVFMGEPMNFCEDREPKEDTTIVVEVMKPTASANVSQKAAVWYRVKADRKIKRVTVTVDGSLVGTFGYNGSKTDITDQKSVDLSGITGSANHEMVVMAIDSQGFSNTTVVPIVITKADTVAPTLMEDKVQVVKKDVGYEVMFFFDDDLSSVVGGTVKRGSELLKSFESNLALFTVDTLSTVSINVKDSYGNALIRDIDLNTYAE